MANSTSSLIGANLQSTDGSTALFTLGTKVFGTDNTEWQYVNATSTFTTGQLVTVNAASTALSLTTALLNAPGVTGLDIGVAQFLINQGDYGFVLKRGSNVYVLCTGTIAAGTAVGLAAAAGKLQAMGGIGAGQTLAGIQITTSASTATASVAIATVTWPRGLQSTGYIA